MIKEKTNTKKKNTEKKNTKLVNEKNPYKMGIINSIGSIKQFIITNNHDNNVTFIYNILSLLEKKALDYYLKNNLSQNNSDIYQYLIEYNENNKNNQHGGYRKGAGRPLGAKNKNK